LETAEALITGLQTSNRELREQLAASKAENEQLKARLQREQETSGYLQKTNSTLTAWVDSHAKEKPRTTGNCGIHFHIMHQ
jgi:molecular chaperone GrpE (heat shock protein)